MKIQGCFMIILVNFFCVKSQCWKKSYGRGVGSEEFSHLLVK